MNSSDGKDSDYQPKSPDDSETIDIRRHRTTDRQHNVDLFLHKTDFCDLCTSYKPENYSAYEAHRTQKELADAEKSRDKELAKKGKCYALVFDQMKVQTCPWIRPTIAYYKMKLLVHSYAVSNLAAQDAKIYWFDESNGYPCASAAASCLYDYVVKLLNKRVRDPVIIYSDGSTRQNRNSTVSNALLHLSVQKNVTIIQKFLERGHTQMECDLVQSAVERTWKNCDVYVPNGFVEKTRIARNNPKPYRAVLLDYSFFKDFGRNKIYPSIRPGRTSGDPAVVDIRAIKYTPDGEMFYKLNFGEAYKPMPLRKGAK